MKHLIIFLVAIFFAAHLTAQNVGINTTNPEETLDVNGTVKINSLNGITTQMVVADTAGKLSVQAIPSNSALVDADGDTQIQVEESADEDVIRFDLGGAEKMLLRQNPNGDAVLQFPNNGSNIFIGENSGTDNTGGFSNLFIGSRTGNAMTSGFNNTILGNSAGHFLTGGLANTFVGDSAGATISSANFNTHIGHAAGAYNPGSNNTFLGYQTGWFSNGSDNVFLGSNAGMFETGSNKLIIENSDSSSPLVYGEFDTDLFQVNGTMKVSSLSGTGTQMVVSDAAGNLSAQALPGTATLLEDGDADTKIQVEETVDDDIIRFDIEGTERFIFSANAGGNSLISFPNTNGNVVLGENAGTPLTTGSSNTVIGTEAGSAISTGFLNTFIGRRSGQSTVGSGDNTFVGGFSGADNVSGGENVFLGSFTGERNIDGSFNSFIGRYAGRFHTTGNNNTFVGYGSGLNNLTGSGNVFLGQNAGGNETGSNRLYIDNSNSSSPLLYGEFDNDILAVNAQMKISSSSSTEAVLMNNNVYKKSANADQVFGTGGGASDFILASKELQSEGSGVHGDGDKITFWSPGDGVTGFSGGLAFFLDEDAMDATNTNPYDNNAVKIWLNSAGTWQVSDERRKSNIQPLENAMDKVMNLNGYTYEFAPNKQEIAKGQQAIPAAGVMAQDLKKVLPEAVNETESGDYFVNYSAIVPLLIEALKDQQEEIDLLKGQLQSMQKK
ncbi:MAG: tail fiber domain-containing protein [Bacteroidota bacterium]